MATTEVTIAIKAVITDFKNKMKQAGKAVGEAKKGIEKEGEAINKTVENLGGKGSLGRRLSTMLDDVASSLGDLAPGLSKAQSTAKGLGDKFKKAGKAGKLAMGALVTAVAGLAVAIAVKLGQAILDATGKFAKMYDPVRYDKAMTRMQTSTKKLKTAIGALASPIFEWMSKAVSAIADAFTWLIEKIMALAGILQGLFGISGKTNESLGDMADSTEEASAAADAGLASFDKLNTLDVGEMGDMEEVAKIEEIMENARKYGADLAKRVKEFVKPLMDFIDKLKNLDLGQIWEDFKAWAIEAWDGIVEYFGGIWESVKETVLSLWDSFTQKVSEAWDWLLTKATEIWNTISTFVLGLWDSFTEKVTGAWDWVLTKATEIWESVKGFVLGLWDSFKEKVSEAWDALLSKAKSTWESVKSFVFGIWDSIKEYFLGKFDEAIEALKGLFEGLWSGVKAAWDKVYAPIKSAVDWLVDKVKWLLDKIDAVRNAVGGAVNKVTDAVGGFFGGIADKVGGVLGFAKGGVFQPNSPQLVMMGDNKSEPEVVAPYSMIVNAVREAVSGMGGFGGGTIVVPVSIDGREVARASYDYLEIERARRGNIS